MTTSAVTFDGSVGRAFTEEARQLIAGEYLPKIETCLEKLTDEQVWWRPNSESNSIGNLVLHLCGNARQWIVCGLGNGLYADWEMSPMNVNARLSLMPAMRCLELSCWTS